MALNAPHGAMNAYIWGDRSLAFHRCKTCGATVCWQSLEDEQFTVNARLCPPNALQGVPVRRFDGADTSRYLD